MSTKATALIKSAEAALAAAEVKKEKARSENETARVAKYKKYYKLLAKDTSNYNEKNLKRHEDILDQLARELVEH